MLHYVQCSETPDIARMLAEKAQTLMDKNAVEDIVKEILLQEGIIKAESQKTEEVQATTETKLMEDIRRRNHVLCLDGFYSRIHVRNRGGRIR